VSDASASHLEALFAEALLLAPGERDAFLADRCAGDDPLRRRLEGLLRHHDAAGSFLERPVAPPRPADPLVHHGAPKVGAQIGPYEILGVLGRGGMGVVYRARQEQPGRVVALKLVRPGLVSERLVRRFEHEIELLGRLEHPGIARVYDAGTFETDEGPEPYFAMELVEGLPLTGYAERAGLSTRQRLALLAEVADAVQHAHERSVIHRDLKPGNIFVDAGGRPRIDFGIARATDSDRQLTTVHTGVGEILGTLAYMSPEQLGGSGQLDTRSDIYALGVIGYELVAGRLPHDVADKPLVEAITTLSKGDPPTLGSLNRGLRGDIEVIVAKAMEKERERRYASAAEFAADIRHFLADEPIVARPPTTAYQVRKLIARHRPLVATVARSSWSLPASPSG
jgi:serine/threonine protein kinase